MRDAMQPIVMVVDDDEAVRDSLQFLLETTGFDVETFASACQYLHAAHSERPLRLLIDQHMPKVSGLDLLRRLRDMGDHSRVALMTGSPSAELTRMAMALGVSEVMEKPLQHDALFRFIQRPCV